MSAAATPGELSGRRQELLVLSAPSGTGKTSLIRRLFATYPRVAEGLVFSVSHTSRAPREGEVHGRDYYFVDRGEFEAMIAEDRFLEWAVVHGQYKGTSRAEVERLLAQGHDVLLDLDVQGAESVLRQDPEVPAIFILPPSYPELEQRLRRRGSDSPEQIELRLRTAREEMRRYPGYDYVILNDDLERACEALAAVFLARRFRRGRMQSQIDRILDGFPPPARGSRTGAEGRKPDGLETTHARNTGKNR